VGPCAVMQLLLDRFGPALPERVDGEWLLLDWQPGRLTLAQSRVRRDWLFIARRRDRVALSGNIERIAALDWIGREIDPLGFAAAFGCGPLRAGASQQTILPGVQRLEPGEVLILTIGAEQRHRAALPAVEPWRGSFDEAVEAARELLHRILADRLSVAGKPGLLLSGGLDSSTLAALVSHVAGGGSGLTAFTSVAPQHGDLIDERAEAAAVAERLNLNHVPVVPDPEASVYRPNADAYAMAGGPTLSPRHYLYHALCAAARDRGVATLFDGAAGEYTLTGYAPLLGPRHRLRQLAKRLLGRGGDPTLGSFYHARLAPHRAAQLDPEASELARQHHLPPAERRPGEAWGWMPGFRKIWEPPTLLHLGLRGEVPFRDPRLLALFAGFPAQFLVHDGLNRAPARAMMAGHLPEAIRLRRTTGAFSPDYMRRIRTQAPAALERLPVFRKAGAEDWIDLVWLEQALQQVGARGPQSIPEAFEVQLTAMAAEFLVWWRGVG
jgi:asparagine synthase (glutamine-hydrolysing)